MSGFCGIVHRDGRPVPPQELAAMASRIAFRGPDGRESRIEESAGLAHALLRTDPDAPAEPQPLSLDGRTWIVADARIDAQRELRRSLVAIGRADAATCGDATLILHAWHAWGEDCVRRLLGDFAFAIWDAAARRLFCARDRLGVKPFFHAHVGDRFIFSNAFESVRAHSAVPDGLDDLAMADFLLFERSLDPRSTGFAAIRRLPAAGWLSLARDGVRTGTYWAPPRDHGVRYRREGDYAEHLRELLEHAVSDRLRTTRVAIQMSGGLDSTTLATLARRALAARGGPFEIHAHAIVYDRLLPDEERRFSTLAAAAIGIPVHHLAADGYALYERFEDFQARFPAPFHGADIIAGLDSQRAAAAHARVLLTGYDGDALLSEPPRPYFRWLWRHRKLATLAGSLVRHGLRRRRPWPRSWGAPAAPKPTPAFPEWIRADLVSRLALRDRWQAFHASVSENHELRPHAYGCLAEIMRTPALFDQYDPSVTGLPLDVRHPFFDLRVVEFCLGLPPHPWCDGKEVLRRAANGLLPEAIRRRPKTGFSGFAGQLLLAHPRSRWIDAFDAAPQLDAYVERRRIPAVHGSARPPLEAWRDLRPLSLDRWLRHALPAPIANEELHHETA